MLLLVAILYAAVCFWSWSYLMSWFSWFHLCTFSSCTLLLVLVVLASWLLLWVVHCLVSVALNFWLKLCTRVGEAVHTYTNVHVCTTATHSYLSLIKNTDMHRYCTVKKWWRTTQITEANDIFKNRISFYIAKIFLFQFYCVSEYFCRFLRCWIQTGMQLKTKYECEWYVVRLSM